MKRIAALWNNKFSKDVFLTAASNIVLAGSGIIVNTIIAKHYHAAGLGSYYQSIAVYSILSIVSVFGINNYSLLKLSETSGKFNHIFYLNSSLAASIVASVPVTVFALLFIFIIKAKLSALAFQSLLLVLPGLPFYALNAVLLSYFNAQRLMAHYSNLQIFKALFRIGITWGVIWLNLSIKYTLLSYLFSDILMFMFFVKMLQNRKLLHFNFKYFFKVTQHFVFGYKTLLVSAVGELSEKMDVLVIGYFLNQYQVGVFSMASTIAKGMLVLFSSVQTNFNPVISRLKSGKPGELQSALTKIRNINFLIACGVFFMAAIAFPIYVHLFLDSSFIYSIKVYYVLLAGVFALSLFGYSGALFTMYGIPEVQLKIVSFSLLLNLIINIVLIKSFGIMGAAIATAISYVFSVILLNFYAGKYIGVSLFKIGGK